MEGAGEKSAVDGLGWVVLSLLLSRLGCEGGRALRAGSLACCSCCVNPNERFVMNLRAFVRLSSSFSRILHGWTWKGMLPCML